MVGIEILGLPVLLFAITKYLDAESTAGRNLFLLAVGLMTGGWLLTFLGGSPMPAIPLH